MKVGDFVGFKGTWDDDTGLEPAGIVVCADWLAPSFNGKGMVSVLTIHGYVEEYEWQELEKMF